ncbi:hypothetical protein C7401_124128 [Paraburkholderia unamae]|nr:hypothetical protein C7401_124128 [Paraburkholderia unamae]
MEKIDLPGADLPATRFAGQLYEPQRSAVSWGAVLAGALSMAAFSLVLLTLGTGLGLSSLSPWPGGMHVKTLGIAAIVWVCVTQIMSGALGGYLAGRLRGHWPDITNDEAHFRDTAHGFLAWALATLVTAALLSSLIAATAREGASVTTSLPDTSALRPPDRGDARHAYGTWPMGYLSDGMLRPATGNTSLSRQRLSSRPPRTLISRRSREFLPTAFLRAAHLRPRTATISPTSLCDELELT